MNGVHIWRGQAIHRCLAGLMVVLMMKLWLWWVTTVPHGIVQGTFNFTTSCLPHPKRKAIMWLFSLVMIEARCKRSCNARKKSGRSRLSSITGLWHTVLLKFAVSREFYDMFLWYVTFAFFLYLFYLFAMDYDTEHTTKHKCTEIESLSNLIDGGWNCQIDQVVYCLFAKKNKQL